MFVPHHKQLLNLNSSKMPAFPLQPLIAILSQNRAALIMQSELKATGQYSGSKVLASDFGCPYLLRRILLSHPLVTYININCSA